MTTLYHAAPIRLAPGSIILPGNWGRIIRSIGERHGRWEIENVFERVRSESYSGLPSRLDCCFACPSAELLQFYVKNGCRDNPCPQVLYEVEKVDAGAREHLTDFNLIAVNTADETIEGNARRYWSGTYWYNIAEHPGLRCEEILTTSPLRVVHELEVQA